MSAPFCSSAACQRRFFGVARMKKHIVRGGLAGLMLVAIGCGLTYPGATPGMFRVNVSSAGNEASGGGSYSPAVSGDGRYMVFTSAATNLVTGDANAVTDVFVHDLQTAETVLVSVASDDTQGNGDSTAPGISDDGRYVVFASSADNLIAVDDNTAWDIFLHDTQTGDTVRVSESTGGAQGDGDSEYPVISGDGSHVAFISAATNLVAADTKGQLDVFLYEIGTAITSRVSMVTGGAEATSASRYADISDDGRYVTFHSWATNLDQIEPDTNGVVDVFLHDTGTGDTIRISMATDGTTQGNGASQRGAISGDGRYIAFSSRADTLTGGDVNGVRDVFLHDTLTGETTLVSVDTGGTQGDGDSDYPAISDDGGYVMFQSAATNLVTGDTNGFSDIFLHEPATGDTGLVSVGLEGAPASGDSSAPDINTDGTTLTFDSDAANLITSDGNLFSDIFTAPNPFL